MTEDPSAKPSTGPAEDPYQALRALLVAPEQQRLDDLEGSLSPSAREVASVLPDAMRQSLENDDSLGRVLAPTIETALHHFARKDTALLAELLYPVMGPAIRGAIAEALRRTVQSMTEVFEHTVSWRAMRWRFEAWRTGRPFGEIVLINSLVYRVEQVFLVHEETGLLLAYAAHDGSERWDADMVSAMLTAVTDYVQDSFGGGDGGLHTLQLGDLTLWVEKGGGAILAGLIRGTPNPGLRDVFVDAIDELASDYGTQLRDFDGDEAPFTSTRPTLERCLVDQAASAKPGRSPALWIALLVLLTGLGTWLGLGLRDAQRRADLIDRVEAAPGLVLTSSARKGGVLHLRGLRDPLATDPDRLRAEAKLPPDAVRLDFTPFFDAHAPFRMQRAREALAPPESLSLSLEGERLVASGRAPQRWLEEAPLIARGLPGAPQLDLSGAQAADADAEALRRARLHLAPPAGVTLSLEGGVLRAQGQASAEWRADARRRAGLIAGVTRYDPSGLEAPPDPFAPLRARLARSRIEFQPGTAKLSPSAIAALKRLAPDFARLLRAHPDSMLIVFGGASADGDPRINEQLRSSRAAAVVRILRVEGLPPTQMKALPSNALTQPTVTFRLRQGGVP